MWGKEQKNTTRPEEITDQGEKCRKKHNEHDRLDRRQQKEQP